MLKNKFYVLISMSFILIFSSATEARGRHYGYSSMSRQSYSIGRTHTVRTHYRRGTGIIMSHRAGNPRSGVHCRNGICY